MHLTLPTTGNWLRLLMIGYGASLLLWMSAEDHAALSVALLGTGLACLLVVVAVLRVAGGRTFTARTWIPGLVALGAVVGGTAVLCTALLMALKTGWHGHPYPDYPPLMIRAMLNRLLAWSAAGACAGAGLVLLRIAVPAAASSTTP